MTVMDKPGISFNAASAISYFTFIPAVAFLLIPPYKDSPCVRFHAWQSILLSMVAFAVDIVLGAIALLTIFLGNTIVLAPMSAGALHALEVTRHHGLTWRSQDGTWN